MIRIKAYGVPKKSNSMSGSTTIVNSGVSSSLADNWFFYDDDNDAVCCRFDFYSVGAVSANGISAGQDSDNTTIIDNLTSTYTDKALSANQGRVLKSLIDNIQTGQGGQSLNTCDWSNLTNVPSTFTPTSHTHSINDITNLQSSLNSISDASSNAVTTVNTHTNNSTIHLSQSQINKLNSLTEQQFTKLAALLDMITVDTENATITVNGSILTTNDVTADV